MTFRIAIVGRPNVGKSTLLNRLVGRRLALVDATPGLTRDRKEAEIELANGPAQIVDTAGFEDAEAGSIEERMRLQTERAIAEADVVVFTIDAREGVTATDEIFAQIVRQSGKPVLLLANKCEGRAGKDGIYEAYSLGLGEPIPISAEHGEGIGELYAQLDDAHLRYIEEQAARENAAGAGVAVDGTDTRAAPEVEDQDGQDHDGEAAPDRPLKVAIVGRPNAGKSTLANQLLGDERMITGPEAGLTRDTVSAEFEWCDGPQSRKIALYDTAGLRKRSRIKQKAEKLSANDALRAIRYAELVILMLDAERPFEKQDLTLGSLVVEEGRALVIAVNKWDLVTDKQARLKELREMCELLLPQVRGVKLVTISAASGQNVGRLMEAVLETERLWNRRIPTGELNRWLLDTVERHPPPAVSGRRIKLRYITQSNARPPTFVAFCSRPEELPTSYTRYLINSLRVEFDLPAVPIRLFTRKGDNPYASKARKR